MRYIISLGSNTLSGVSAIEEAMESLSELGTLTGASAIYSTEPVSGVGPGYHNAVIALDSGLDYRQLDHRLKEMELEAGRDEDARRNGVVPLDIDIVIAGDEIVRPKDFARTYFTIGYESLFPNIC